MSDKEVSISGVANQAPPVKIFFATPMYGGMCTGLYAKSMMNIPGVLGNVGIGATMRFIMNNSLIQSARNDLADMFLKEEDCTHLMFIDADIEFDATDIIHMINANVGVIGGAYPRKSVAWNRVRDAIAAGVPDDRLELHTGDMVIHMLADVAQATVKATEPFKVAGAGTGFMLIKREVLKQLIGKVDSYKNDSDVWVNEFFYLQKHPVTGKQMSEDYSFCYKCRENGIDVYIAPWAAFTHVGTYNFKGSPVRMYKDLA